jgi:hypothetical protein
MAEQAVAGLFTSPWRNQWTIASEDKNFTDPDLSISQESIDFTSNSKIPAYFVHSVYPQATYICYIAVR